MTSYRITPRDAGVMIELTEVGDRKQHLLAAFGECQAGECSCPTTEYEKVAEMDVQPSDDAITLALRAKPGVQLDTEQIAACLNYTVAQADTDPPPTHHRGEGR